MCFSFFLWGVYISLFRMLREFLCVLMTRMMVVFFEGDVKAGRFP